MRVVPFAILAIILLAAARDIISDIAIGNVPGASLLIAAFAVLGLYATYRIFPNPFVAEDKNSDVTSSGTYMLLRAFLLVSVLFMFSPLLLCLLSGGSSFGACAPYSFLMGLTLPIGLVAFVIISGIMAYMRKPKISSTEKHQVDVQTLAKPSSDTASPSSSSQP